MHIMNCTYKIYCIYIVNKAFHHSKNKLSYTDNSNSTIVALVIVEKCVS